VPGGGLMQSHPVELDGSTLSIWWSLPFLTYLFLLAMMPVLAGQFWHKHYGKISIGWGLITLLTLVGTYGLPVTQYTVIETYMHHFIPFIIFILTFYVICGGINIDIVCRASPLVNVVFLSFAAFLASWIGTTGAAMLFIRPFLHMNRNLYRRHHLVIFFIFLVCNIGGALTAVGDPPLFLGFLNGVDFFWPLIHLMGPFLTIMIPLLGIFYLVDGYLSRQILLKPQSEKVEFRVKILGIRNFVLLGLALTVIILSGIWHPNVTCVFFGVKLTLESLLRDFILVILTLLSLRFTPKVVRNANAFSWGPLKEVFIIFATIFLIAAPMFAILKAGNQGAFAGLVKLINNNDQPHNLLYYWLTGGLSAFLDNAPTYLIFFNLAGGNASSLMVNHPDTLAAISLGAVFMGALTYIGNAPNFMVKAIAEEQHIRMPSFMGYLGWSFLFLIPLLILVGWLWLS